MNNLPLPAGVQVFERGWLSSNNVLFASGQCVALVDTGYVAHSDQTLALVRNALGARPLDLIVNTHLHSDHCGGNAALQAAYPAARTVIPPGLAEAVRTWDEEALSYRATGQNCAPFRLDDVIRPGTELVLGDRPWEVHAAPGHDPHSVILFERGSRTLISADALWENGYGVIFPELEGKAAFGEVAATLDVIELLQPQVVIPGHGSVFAGSDRVATALGRARKRLEGQVRDPARHATHGIKVLIKFKLLEWQTADASEFFGWAASTPYVRVVHAAFFSAEPLREWLARLVAELEASGVLARADGKLYNI